MKAQTGPASKELKSLEEFEKYLQAQETTVIGLFEKDSDLKSVFLKFADKQREKLRFGHTSDKEVLKKQEETDAIVLFRAPQYQNKFESNQVKFDGSSLSDLDNFAKKH